MAHSEQREFRAWLKRFAHWLFSTDHIGIQYGIEYDGLDIQKLSPGTRGIVLLLLYLELGDADGRPLVIDQPEENLDPKSVFEELVGLFVEAKSNRQVIMVTHNANLVINTDADQVIIAEAGPHRHGALPPISYEVWRTGERRNPQGSLRHSGGWRRRVPRTGSPVKSQPSALRHGDAAISSCPVIPPICHGLGRR